MGCGRGNNDVGGHHQSRGCVCEVVRSILEIQNAAVQDDCNRCATNCFLEPLGGIVSPSRSNADTRVFTLLNKDGSPFFATFRTANGTPCACVSIYFRVEDVFDGCCATLRVLIPQDENGCTVELINDYGKIDFNEVCRVTQFEASDSCVTVDLDCFCAVQCIDDVYLGICD